MKLISKADLYNRTNRELDGLKEEFRKVAGTCEQTWREAYAPFRTSSPCRASAARSVPTADTASSRKCRRYLVILGCHI